MMTIVEETPEYIVYNHIGVTRYTGCQCIRDCTCKEYFVSHGYNFYSVKKKFGKYKTTHHNTLDEVKARIQVLMAISNKKYHENHSRNNCLQSNGKHQTLDRLLEAMRSGKRRVGSDSE